MYKCLFATRAASRTTSTAIKIHSLAGKFLTIGVVLALAACGGHDSGGDESPKQPAPPSPPSTYSIGGGISGLNAAGLILQNNLGDDLIVAANASSFQFATPVAAGGVYDVTIAAQPSGQACSVSNGSGGNVHAAVTDVGVTCSAGHAISFSGANVFFSQRSPQSVVVGSSLSLTVTPEANYTRLDTVGGTCAAGSWAGNIYTTGIISADCTLIFSAGISKVSGNISGLAGTVSLAINGADNLTRGSDGPFTFSTPLPEGLAYTVTVAAQPVGQTCNIANAAGTMGSGNINNVAVTCVIDTFTVTPSAGANGSISPNSPQSVNFGANQTFTATPNSGYVVKRWLLDGSVVQTGGTTYQLNNVQANHSVTVVFKNASPRFAYIGSFSGNNLIKCDVNASTDALSNCAATGSGFSAPAGIALNPANTIAYVSNYTATYISQCNVNSTTGALSGCANAGANGLANPDPLSVNLNAAGTLAYITKLNSSTVALCSVNAGTGALSGCANSGAVLTSSQPQFVRFNAAGTYAYIPTYANSHVVKCAVNAGTGALGSCVSTGSGFNGTAGIDIDASGTVVYVANFDGNTVSKCNIAASDGALTGCTITAGSGFNAPQNIMLNRAGTILYVENFNTNTLSKCDVDEITGDLSNCVDSGATGLNNPNGLELLY